MKKENLKKCKNIDIKFYPLLLLIILLTIITGCGKEKFTENLFTKTVKKNNFVVAELPEDEKTIFLAVSTHYQISLYKFKNSETCLKEFKLKKKEYKAKKSNIKDKKIYFYVENDNVYTLIYRENNYYIEVETPKNYKKDVIKLLKKMDLEL